PMSSGGGYDEIRAILAQVAALGQGDVGEADFYPGMLRLVLDAMQAPAGLVWTLGEGGQVDVACQAGIEVTGLAASPEAGAAHNALVPVLLQNSGGLVIPPRAEVTGPDGQVLATNPTDLLVVAAPFNRGGVRAGLIEVFHQPAEEQVQRGYLVFLEEVAALAANYLGQRQMAVIDARETALSQVEQFARRVHESLDPVATAFVLANEVRRIVGCDRVGVLVRRRRKLRLEAVSGQESVERRASAVQAIEALVRAVAKAGEPLWHPDPGRELPPQIEEELENYIDESHATALAIIPLAKPRPTAVVKPGGIDATAVAKAEAAPADAPEPIGALVVEWFAAGAIDAGARGRVELVADHGKVALANALDHTGLPLYRVLNLAGKSRVLTTARNLPRTVLAGLGTLAALAALVLVPAELRLEAKGTLEPVKTRDVFAPLDGVVDGVAEGVEHGRDVKADDVLVTLRNTELDVAFEDVQGRLDSSREQLRSVERSLLNKDIPKDEHVRLEGQKKQLQKETASLELQRQLHEKKRRDLEVKSPIDGRVVTWQVRDRLYLRPVEKGQVLLTVADKTAGWELELHVPDDRLGHVNRAAAEAAQAGRDLEVEYVLATDPGTRHRGTVKWREEKGGRRFDIHEQAEVHGDEGNTALVRVNLEPKPEDGGGTGHAEEQLSAGASVTARIACGRRPLGYVWFHDVLAFIRTQILFRLW
ncbi:MAG: HlyD family efflux transporter periplasmic adaptor subunit, partial [Planctomycetaceae bacterium]